MTLSSFSYLCAVEVFILSPDCKEVLLLKRGMHKRVLPGYYAGVGGKMDAGEVETPYEAALREMLEEAEYTLEDLEAFNHKATYTVKDKFGKWNVFEFVGHAKRKLFEGKKEIHEGVLEWVPITMLPRLKLIQDLRNGYLEKILFGERFLWIAVTYDGNDLIETIRDAGPMA
jgi:8-oxo-dGTP pyrophosphatase MutT (NUDIX family)